MSSPPRRHPTIHFPSLHLGSFESLSPDSFPSPSPNQSPGSRRLGSPVLNGPSPTQREFDTNEIGMRKGDTGNRGGRGGPSRLPLPDWHNGSRPGGSGGERPRSPQSIALSSPSWLGPGPFAYTDPSRSPSKTRGLPAALPPPILSLPPLPSLSPISPINPLPVDADSSKTRIMDATLPIPPSFSNRSRPPSPLSRPSSSIGFTARATPQRPSGPSLTISIPSSSSTPATPPPQQYDFGPLAIRESPSMARRRTVVQASPAASRTSPHVYDVVDPLPASPNRLPASPSPSPPNGKSTLDRASYIMPVARPLQPIDSQSVQTPSPRRLERKASTHDLKNASPVSPTPKRSLPRPPTASSQGSFDIPGPRTRSSLPSIHPAPAAPTASSTWPPLNVQARSGSPTAVKERVSSSTLGSQLPKHPTLTQTARPMQSNPIQPSSLTQTPQSQHRPHKSASYMPIVPGLAEAGPYSAATAQRPSAPPPADTSRPNLGIGRPAPNNGLKVPAEEVCLECMMRDRDLADVVVSGEGAWERSSDVDFEEMKWKEETILTHMGLAGGAGGSSVHGTASVPSLGHESDSDDDSSSLPSTGHSMSDVEVRRRVAARNGRREAKRARRREVDWRVSKEVGWKGFKWEVMNRGDGLPEGFRGCRGGPLSEQGIKRVMLKFPSASLHRAEHMQNYLSAQAILVRKIRAEAERMGKFPDPGEAPIPNLILTSDGTSIIAGPRTSSVAWEAKHARDLSAQIRGAFNSTPNGSPGLSLVRPSPSSPADLAAMGARPHPPTLTRPLTLAYPEPSRSPSSLVPSTRSRYAKGIASPSQYTFNTTSSAQPRLADEFADADEELWQPISPAESGLRPFSFAVRAGATAKGKGSSDGHGRRSVFGRWGGSVTSFFGGSQGGSGSMMDMHLGLDNDRQNGVSTNYVHSHPRAVSLASPPRTPFFNRDTRASSVHGDVPRERDHRISTSVSTSRLSQMTRTEPDDEDETPHPKKGGFKGFFNKMKPKGHKKESSKSARSSKGMMMNVEVDQDRQSDASAPLALPPPISVLGDNRMRSGSASSAQTDSSVNRNVLPYSHRSVSVPHESSSGGSPSSSPTSSRYNRRESYASGRDEMDKDRRGSAVEMLAAGRYRNSPDPMDEVSFMPRANGARGNDHLALPPQAFRSNNKANATLSNFSLVMPTIETPPPVTQHNGFFTVASNLNQGMTKSLSASLSPNRFKNLPPLPPIDSGLEGERFSTSPDSFRAAFPDQADFSDRPYPAQTPRVNGYAQSVYDSPAQSTRNSKDLPSGQGDGHGYRSSQPQNQPFDYRGRASFEPGQQRKGEPYPRTAQSMYAQPSAASSASSFRMLGAGRVDGKRDYEEKKGKGLKGFWGAARAGRVA